MPRNQGQLKQSTKSGNPAPKSVTDARNAIDIYNRLVTEGATRAKSDQTIQGLIDGNRPYSKAELIKRGQGWRANVNDRSAESIRDQNAAAFWSLLTDVPSLIDVKFRRSKGDAIDTDWSGIIAEEYTDLMFEWDDFFYNMMLHQQDMLTFGVGPVAWLDKYDWRFKATPYGSLRIPPRTKSTIGGVNIFFLEDTMSARDLFEIIENEKSFEYGWNIDELKKVAIDRWYEGKLEGQNKYSKDVLLSIQQQVKNNDYFADLDDLGDLQVVHQFVREPKSGKVSMFTFPRENNERNRFMLEARDSQENMRQVFCPFLFNIGDGFIRSVKGLGHRMYQLLEINNRLICSALDASALVGSLIVGGAGNKKDLRLLRIGPVTMLPEGVQPIQQSFAPNLNQIIGVRSMLQTIMNNNHGVFQRAQEHPDMPDRTALEVKVAEEKEARLQNFQVTQYYVHLDRMHREIMRRLLSSDYPTQHPGYDEREDFIKRCEERGVPREMLKPGKFKVTSVRAIGSGSATIRKMNATEVHQMSAMFDERGKMNATRDKLAVLVGYAGVDRYLPQQNRNQIMTSEHAMANLENNDLIEGAACVVGVDQPHVIHMMIHGPQLAEVLQTMAQVVQSGQPMNATASIPYLEKVIMHAGQHVQLMAQDPRNKQYVEQFTMLVKQAQVMLATLQKIEAKNEKMRQQAMQQNAEVMAQAQQSVQSEDLKVKLAKIQADFQVDMASAQSKAQIKETVARHGMMLKQMMAEAKIQLAQRQAEAKEGQI